MNDKLNEVIQSAKAPVIDKLEDALEINRELVKALEAFIGWYWEDNPRLAKAIELATEAIAKQKETADDRR